MRSISQRHLMWCKFEKFNGNNDRSTLSDCDSDYKCNERSWESGSNKGKDTSLNRENSYSYSQLCKRVTITLICEESRKYKEAISHCGCRSIMREYIYSYCDKRLEQFIIIKWLHVIIHSVGDFPFTILI